MALPLTIGKQQPLHEDGKHFEWNLNNGFDGRIDSSINQF